MQCLDNLKYKMPVINKTNIDDDISTFCKVEQKPDLLCRIKEDRMITQTIQTSKALLKAQQTDTYCQNVIKLLGTDNQFTESENRMLYARKLPIDRFAQVIVPEVFFQTILYNGNFLILVGHTDTHWMYDKLQRHFYWSQMAANV